MRLNVVALLGSLALAEAYFKPVAPKMQAPKLFSLAARAPKLRCVPSRSIDRSTSCVVRVARGGTHSLTLSPHRT